MDAIFSHFETNGNSFNTKSLVVYIKDELSMILAPCQTAIIDFQIRNLKYFSWLKIYLLTINDMHSRRDDYMESKLQIR